MKILHLIDAWDSEHGEDPICGETDAAFFHKTTVDGADRAPDEFGVPEWREGTAFCVDCVRLAGPPEEP